MTGFELKLWRRGMNWDQERAAEELGVSVRSYKRYEKAQNIAKLIELATFALSTKNDKGNRVRLLQGNELFAA